MQKPSEAEINRSISRLQDIIDRVGDPDRLILPAIWALEKQLPKEIRVLPFAEECPDCESDIACELSTHCHRCGQKLKPSKQNGESFFSLIREGSELLNKEHPDLARDFYEGRE